ncbi:rhodanese-like domain-containing protein [Rubritalea marina]|uniref:rhodanese-like domain-containing protein n=1 Tax=Rubritalea marina TaxID=361055 RepID=UPI0003785D33|nr:rhodanese-like domain-containing protein [Rubritalea marina]
MQTIPISDFTQSPEDYYLVDVRTPSEFEEAHILGAQNHPLGSLNPSEISFKSQGKQVVLTCLSGARCQKAASELAGSNLKLAQLDGSLMGWESAGQPVVRSTPSGIPLIRQVHLCVSTINLTAALLAIFVSSSWAWVLVGTGAGLFIAGATGFCGMGILLAKMPWNRPAKQRPEACALG